MGTRKPQTRENPTFWQPKPDPTLKNGTWTQTRREFWLLKSKNPGKKTQLFLIAGPVPNLTFATRTHHYSGLNSLLALVEGSSNMGMVGTACNMEDILDIENGPYVVAPLILFLNVVEVLYIE